MVTDRRWNNYINSVCVCVCVCVYGDVCAPSLGQPLSGFLDSRKQSEHTLSILAR